MPAGGKIGNKGGTGNPGYGALNFVRQKVEKHCPLWWNEWERIMVKGKSDERKFAMQEFNKLQAKLMPTIVGGEEGKPLILQFNEVFKSSQGTTEDNTK